MNMSDPCQLKLFPSTPAWRIGSLIIVLLASVAVRLPALNDPHLHFVKQAETQRAMIALGLYAQSDPNIEGRDAILKNFHQPQMEMRIIPNLAALTFRLLSPDDIWLIRSINCLFWLLASVFVFRLALRFTPWFPAVIAVALFNLLPYSVLASRAFQPEPLMMLAIAGTLDLAAWAIERWRPQRWLLLLCAVLACAAIKPHSLFFVVPAIGFGAIAARGWRKALLDPFPPVAGLALAAFVWWHYSSGATPGVIRNFAIPSLALSPGFWRGWLQSASVVVGLPLLALALVGFVLVRAPMIRGMLSGYAFGYAAFALTFTLALSTHPYYHEPLILLVALAVAPLAAGLLDGLDAALTSRHMAWALRAAAVVALIFSSLTALRPVTKQWTHNMIPADPDEPEVFATIGRELGHSVKVLHISPENGLPLRYYARIAGHRLDVEDLLHPNSIDLSALDQRVAKALRERNCEFFVIADPRVLERLALARPFQISGLRELAWTRKYAIFAVD
jgi:4-amino-4-deoxy-L-arabinose transferase-like glycosyltransferase